MKRRTLLMFLVSAGTAIGAAAMSGLGLTSIASPALARRRREHWRPIGRLEDFPVGEVRTGMATSERTAWPRPLSPQGVFVWRPNSYEIVVYSRSCTDLACPLSYDAGSACFFCPCHGGVFSQEGNVMAGPPNRSLDRYKNRLRDGVIEIDLASLPIGW